MFTSKDKQADLRKPTPNGNGDQCRRLGIARVPEPKDVLSGYEVRPATPFWRWYALALMFVILFGAVYGLLIH